MKLVVGIDFSKNARAAGITAAALAGRWNETLAVAHVVDDSVSHRLPGDVRETLAASTSDRLHSEAVHLGSEGVKVEEHMLLIYMLLLADAIIAGWRDRGLKLLLLAGVAAMTAALVAFTF